MEGHAAASGPLGPGYLNRLLLVLAGAGRTDVGCYRTGADPPIN